MFASTKEHHSIQLLWNSGLY